MFKILGNEHILIELLLIWEASCGANAVFAVINSCLRICVLHLGDGFVKVHNNKPLQNYLKIS